MAARAERGIQQGRGWDHGGNHRILTRSRCPGESSSNHVWRWGKLFTAGGSNSSVWCKQQGRGCSRKNAALGGCSFQEAAIQESFPHTLGPGSSLMSAPGTQGEPPPGCIRQTRGHGHGGKNTLPGGCSFILPAEV